MRVLLALRADPLLEERGIVLHALQEQRQRPGAQASKEWERKTRCASCQASNAEPDRDPVPERENGLLAPPPPPVFCPVFTGGRVPTQQSWKLMIGWKTKAFLLGKPELTSVSLQWKEGKC